MKLTKTIMYILLTLSLVLCSAKANTTKYDYVITVDIDASKEKVWSVLTDFKNYSKWNSILKMENNENIKLGKKFDVTIFEEDGSITDSFQAIAVNKSKYKSFSASQTILTKSFFKATHYFMIEEISENKVSFSQKWELEGVVGYLFESMIFDALDLFKKMNLELKAEVEKQL